MNRFLENNAGNTWGMSHRRETHDQKKQEENDGIEKNCGEGHGISDGFNRFSSQSLLVGLCHRLAQTAGKPIKECCDGPF